MFSPKPQTLPEIPNGAASLDHVSTVPSPQAKPQMESSHVQSHLNTVDDLLRDRASDKDQVPLVAYPVSNREDIDYEHFTAKQLDVFAEKGARTFMKRGLQQTVRD